MEIKIADVIHLYLDVEVQTNFRVETTEGQPLKKLKGTLKEVDLGMWGGLGVLLENETDKCNYKYFKANEIKPYLRSLSDITRDELLEYGRMFTPEFNPSEEDIIATLEQIKEKGIDAFLFEETSLPKISLIVLWFTKKQFDVFGLIATAQALNKETEQIKSNN